MAKCYIGTCEFKAHNIDKNHFGVFIVIRYLEMVFEKPSNSK